MSKVLEREGAPLKPSCAKRYSFLSSLSFLDFAALVSIVLHVLSLPPCIFQALSEWGAYWVLGGILIHEFPLFKSGEHTCKVYAADEGEDSLGPAAHPQFAVSPCIAP
ncbi:unnamed protein product [Victoria cruziana]